MCLYQEAPSKMKCSKLKKWQLKLEDTSRHSESSSFHKHCTRGCNPYYSPCRWINNSLYCEQSVCISLKKLFCVFKYSLSLSPVQLPSHILYVWSVLRHVEDILDIGDMIAIREPVHFTCQNPSLHQMQCQLSSPGLVFIIVAWTLAAFFSEKMWVFHRICPESVQELTKLKLFSLFSNISSKFRVWHISFFVFLVCDCESKFIFFANAFNCKHSCTYSQFRMKWHLCWELDRHQKVSVKANCHQ